MYKETLRKITSLSLLTILLTSTAAFAMPNALPQAHAATNANLFVSAESSQFNNYFAGPQVVPLALPLKVDGTNTIDLVDLIGVQGRRCRIGVAGNQRRQPDARQSDPMTLEHPLDGPQTGDGPNMERFQFGQDGLGTDQAVAGSWVRLRFDPLANSEDGPLDLGRQAARMMIDMGQFEQAFGTFGPIAAPPAMEPVARAVWDPKDRLDRFAHQAELDRPLVIFELVFHPCLRGTNQQRFSHGATVNDCRCQGSVLLSQTAFATVILSRINGQGSLNRSNGHINLNDSPTHARPLASLGMTDNAKT